MTPENKSCETCDFFEFHNRDVIDGICKNEQVVGSAYITKNNSDTNYIYPRVESENKCEGQTNDGLSFSKDFGCIYHS